MLERFRGELWVQERVQRRIRAAQEVARQEGLHLHEMGLHMAQENASTLPAPHQTRQKQSQRLKQ